MDEQYVWKKKKAVWRGTAANQRGEDEPEACGMSDIPDDVFSCLEGFSDSSGESLSPRAPLAGASSEEEEEVEEGPPSPGGPARPGASCGGPGDDARPRRQAVSTASTEPDADRASGGGHTARRCCHHTPQVRALGELSLLLGGVVGPTCSAPGRRPEMRHKRSEDGAAPEAVANGGVCAGDHGQHHSTARSILKSVLKRTGSKKASKAAAAAAAAASAAPASTAPAAPAALPAKKKNRVQFDESLNKFFDADYVILIKEEDDDLDGECDDGDEQDDEEEVCTCSLGVAQRQAAAAAAAAAAARGRGFDLNFPEACAFEPPIEFIDQVTLSPPEGYKDVVNHQHGHHACRQQRVDVATETASGDINLDVDDDADDVNADCVADSISEAPLQQSGPEATSGRGGSLDESLTSRDSHQQQQQQQPQEPVVSDIAVHLQDSPRQDKDAGCWNRASVPTQVSPSPPARKGDIDPHTPAGENGPSYTNTAGAENGKFQQQRYIVETITMTTVTERRIVREAGDNHGRGQKSRNFATECENLRPSGILKGGKLWKSPEGTQNCNPVDETSTSFSTTKESDNSESTTGRRSVRFSEQAASQDTAVGHQAPGSEDASSPDSTELTLTFRLGNHVMVSNNTRPNSAVRQLFPSSQRLLSPPPLPHRDDDDEDDAMRPDDDSNQPSSDGAFTVTAESLKAFEESKRAKSLTSTQQPVAQPSSTGIQTATGGSDDESPKTHIRRTIERNALRRSLLRYSNNTSRNRKVTTPPVKKNSENSLVERIRKLTCDLDEEEEGGTKIEKEGNGKKPGVDVATETAETDTTVEQTPTHSSPTKEEVKKTLERAAKFIASPNSDYGVRLVEKTASPSASTSSSNSSGSSSSTYKKLTDLFARRSNAIPDSPTVSTHSDAETPQPLSLPLSTSESHNWGVSPCHHLECAQFKPPDLGNGVNSSANVTPPKDFAGSLSPGAVSDGDRNFVGPKCAVSRMSVTAEARKQFLSTLAPLTACVSAPHGAMDEERYQQVTAVSSDRVSVTSSSTTGEETNYTLDDIDEALKDDQKAPQPDLVAGTQTEVNGGGAVDELALFVQQDAGRIERIKKRYSLNSSGGTPTASDDDEHDDYGFNRRPSVRGIKPRFCSTSEILQQMQSQLHPPALACPSRVTWPHCSPGVGEDSNGAFQSRRRGAMPSRCSATMPVLQEENPYGPPPDQHQLSPQQQPEVERSRRYIAPNQIMYASTGNLYQHPQQIMRIGGGCSEMYLPHPAASNSPPPRHYPQLQDPHFLPDDQRFSSVQSLDRSCAGGGFSRRSSPHQQGLMHMRVSPVTAGTHYAPPFPDSAIIEPHYSTLQYAKTGPTSVIRLGQGQQQTIRVPYPSGTPVQVHLLARTGVGAPRSESPQRGVSPSVGHQAPAAQFCNQYPYSYPAQSLQYAVARGTQTATMAAITSPAAPLYPAPPNGRYYPPQSQPNHEHHLVHSPPQQPVNRTTSPLPSSSPTRSKFTSERGVPEGAASSSPSFPQDSSYPSSPAVTPATSVYYAMNV